LVAPQVNLFSFWAQKSPAEPGRADADYGTVLLLMSTNAKREAGIADLSLIIWYCDYTGKRNLYCRLL